METSKGPQQQGKKSLADRTILRWYGISPMARFIITIFALLAWIHSYQLSYLFGGYQWWAQLALLLMINLALFLSAVTRYRWNRMRKIEWEMRRKAMLERMGLKDS